MSGIEVEVVNHYLDDDALNREMPDGWHNLKDDEVYKELERIPASYKVIEHHKGVYASKDYMWVYHSPGVGGSEQIYLYEYDNGSRATAVIDRYLEGYKGIIVSDGYASYHSLEKRRTDLKISGCWVHCKRRYSEIIKSVKRCEADQSATSGKRRR